MPRPRFADIRDSINAIADEINSDLNTRQANKYFQDIVLLYSFIENLITWLVFIKLLWDRTSSKMMSEHEFKVVRAFCRRLNFASMLDLALAVKLINRKLHKRCNEIRLERNDIVHQLWLYEHRNNQLVARNKLVKLTNVANDLIGEFNKVTKRVGVDEVFSVNL